MRFTFSTQIGAMLAQVFSPDGKSVAIFDATDPPEVANARAASMALLLNGGVPKQEQPEAVQVPHVRRYTIDEIADACVQAEISDGHFESLSIALLAAPQSPAQAEPCDMGPICIGCEPRGPRGECPGAQAEARGDELACAEEVLDGYAAHLPMTETAFECIGDYIAAVVSAMRAPAADWLAWVAEDGYRTDAERAAAKLLLPLVTTAPAAPQDDDLVAIPRGLIGAACSAIDKKRDAPKVLEQLRRYTVGDLSKAPTAPQAGDAEPLFLLHTGQIDGGGEQDEWETEANSWTAVEEFCRQHPGKTIGLYPASQPMSREVISQAARDVLAERQRQIEAEGWTPEHDDSHHDGTLAQAAGCYATWAFEGEQLPNWVPTGWPWADSWWKPSTPRLNLIRAGALILAELERLDRASAHGIGSGSGTGASHD